MFAPPEHWTSPLDRGPGGRAARLGALGASPRIPRRFRAHGSLPRDERTVIARWLSHVTLIILVLLVPLMGGLLGPHSSSTAASSGLPTSARADDSAAVASRGFILKPAGLGQTAQSHRDVVTYAVQDGDVLGSIAEKYGLRIDTLRQTNQLADVDSLALGQKLLIPPTNGILVKVGAGETVPQLADRYHVDAATIIGYNAVRNPLQLAAGSFLMIPDGTGFTASQDAGPQAGSAAPAAAAAPDEIPHGRSSYNHFPWGQCTYYVASRRNIPWNGDAWMWFGNARAAGYATGSTPRVGAVMVTWESRYYGHVALVDAVYGDGSYVVSEMNYRGLGIVDQRHIIPGQVPLIGFIYE
ncbi:MAG: CHAP domain-containing protein [Candidatus Dormibacteria bacterium]